jgi:hypothetical protein
LARMGLGAAASGRALRHRTGGAYRAMVPLMYAFAVMGDVGVFALASFAAFAGGHLAQDSASGARSTDHRRTGAPRCWDLATQRRSPEAREHAA